MTYPEQWIPLWINCLQTTTHFVQKATHPALAHPTAFLVSLGFHFTMWVCNSSHCTASSAILAKAVYFRCFSMRHYWHFWWENLLSGLSCILQNRLSLFLSPYPMWSYKLQHIFPNVPTVINENVVNLYLFYRKYLVLPIK